MTFCIKICTIRGLSDFFKIWWNSRMNRWVRCACLKLKPKFWKEKSCKESPKNFPKCFSKSRRLDQNWKKTNCEEERRPRHWIRVWCALLKRSTEIFLNSNRKSLHKLNFSHHDWFGEMNTNKTMALEEVLDGVLPLLWSKRSFCSLMLSFLRVFRYLAQEDLLRKYLH